MCSKSSVAIYGGTGGYKQQQLWSNDRDMIEDVCLFLLTFSYANDDDDDANDVFLSVLRNHFLFCQPWRTHTLQANWSLLLFFAYNKLTD